MEYKPTLAMALCGFSITFCWLVGRTNSCDIFLAAALIILGCSPNEKVK